MGGFKVDTGAVRNLGNQVSKVHSDLSSATAPHDLSDGEAGSRDVGQALRDFHNHWRTEQATLLENLQELADAIKGAADAYEKADVAVGNAAEGKQA